VEGGEESESAADLDEYLNELGGEEGGSGSDSGDGVDVSEYIKGDPDPQGGI